MCKAKLWVTTLLTVVLLTLASPAWAEDPTASPSASPSPEPSASSEPTGSGSEPLASEPPASLTEPTETTTTEPCGSVDQPCFVILSDQDLGLVDWMQGMGLAAALLVALGSLHVVGSWRR